MLMEQRGPEFNVLTVKLYRLKIINGIVCLYVSFSCLSVYSYQVSVMFVHRLEERIALGLFV